MKQFQKHAREGAIDYSTAIPFLDKYVVQEFLWLNSDLKNKFYKAPLHNYLKTKNYPFVEKEKIGFSALY